MKTKRLLAGLLTLVMLVGLLPTAALAAKRDNDAVPLEAPVDETPAALAAPVWEDAAASLSAGEVDLSTLVNVAETQHVTVENSGLSSATDWLDTTASHLTDGVTDSENSEYKWVNGGVQAYINDKGFAPWVSLSFAQPRPVGGLKIYFEHDDSQDVTYTYNIWTKASADAEYTKWGENLTATKKANGYIQTHTFASLTDIISIKIEITSAKSDNNTKDGAWIVLRQVQIFGTPLDLSTLDNIAPDGTVTTSTPVTNEYTTQDHPEYLTDGKSNTEFKWVGQGIRTYITSHGNPWVNLSFDENCSIGGLRITFEHKDPDGDNVTYKYNVLGKASGATEYRTLLSNCTATKLNDGHIQTHAFNFMEELSDIKIEFTNESSDAWIVMTQLEIFGQPLPDPYEGLIDVAPLSNITVPNHEDQIGNIIDGDVGTWWASDNGNWNTNIDFALPGNLAVKRVELDFERYDGRTFDLAVSRAVNNVTSDYQQLTAKNGHSANETFVYDMAEPQRMTHVRVSLLGTNGTAWPAIAEVRVYAVDETIDLNNYTDITQYADITTGSDYKEWDFHGNQQIAGFRVSLPNGVSATLKGKMKRDSKWTTYFTELQNGDNVFDFLKGMSIVRLELSDPSQLSDLQIFGTYSEPIIDRESIAFDIVPHTNYGSATAYLLTDGNTQQPWTAEMYPVYIDIDLEENYNLSQIEVYAPENGQTEYTLYTSMDGSNFTIVDEAHTSGPKSGPNAHTLSNVEARVVRVYVEYYSQSASPSLNEIRVIGTASGTAVQPTPTVTVEDFETTDYASRITDQDVYDEVKGIIRRQINDKNPNDVDYTTWFTLDIQPTAANGYDYFTLTDEGDTIKVTGNNGVSLATGINHYLKYFCNVHISQVGNQVNMPDAIVPIDGTVHKETKFPVRYAYNYCTHSYTMSFWNEKEWRNELDWQALNGVNVVLDITGQEEVWREFLMSVGYTHQEAKDFLAGPGYYAWAYMANLTGFGGPIHDSFLTQRVELGRKNQRIMRTLGMYPVLQAFSGMVPVDITDHDPSAEVIPQGVWCSFQRPAMLKTNTATYDKYADLFYAAQKRVFGDAKYYATDPFHEGGDTGGMSGATVASELLDSLLKADPDAVWIIQSWQGNPTTSLLSGLRQGTDRRDHALVLDLYAEKVENWKAHNGYANGYGEDLDGDGDLEFSDTPWVWCMLNNFGGRMGLHGHLDALQQNIPAAANSAKHMAGVGMSPEGAQENPVLYDFLFETIWTDNASQALPTVDLDQWLNSYVLRRYGAQSDNAETAMEILAQTVYKSSLNMTGQGAPESVINARPALSIDAASTWGKSTINYSKGKLEKAAELLLADYDTLSASDAYLYDVADVLKQVLSNTAQKVHSDMAAAYSSGDAAEFKTQSDRFLGLIDTLEEVLGTRSEFTFGKWTEGAELMADGTDDFTKRLYLRNAKALVTTWGSIQQSSAGGLQDYSNRQWAGLTNDYYKARWVEWINQAKANLANNSTAAINIDWFPWEWSYARNHQVTYSSETNGLDLKALGETILTNYSVRDPLGEKDIDPATMTVKCGTQHYGDDEDDRAINVLDRDANTIWHTEWTPAAAQSSWWISFDLGKVKCIDGLRYLPRHGTNNTGRITGYEIYVSSSSTDWAGTTNTWTKVTDGTWVDNAEWKTASFDNTSARYVKLVATSSSHAYVSAAEIRITRIPATGVTLDKAEATIYTNATDPNHTVTLAATVSPANASNTNVVWTTSDPDIAMVSQTGVVTAVGVDEFLSQATITATTEDGGFEASCVVSTRAKIDGEVTASSPSGAAKFGETLTASINSISSQVAARHLSSYQWKRGGVDIPGATERAYTVTQDDIGQSITVSLGFNPPYVGTLTSAAVTPTVADGPAAPAGLETADCTTSENNDGKITGLTSGVAYEISSNGGATWDPATVTAAGAIENLTPGDYQIRLKATATHAAGLPSTAVTVASYEAPPMFTITVSALTGGSVTASKGRAQAGDPITLTVTPTDGYLLVADSLKVTDANGNISITNNQFTMPAGNVTVTAQFKIKTYTLKHNLTHISCSMGEGDHTVEHGEMPIISLTPDVGFTLPENLTVTTADGAKFSGYEFQGNRIEFTQGITQDLSVNADAVRSIYQVRYNLTNLSAETPILSATYGQPLTVILTADHEGYGLPSSITVTVDGAELAKSDYTYEISAEAAVATVTIPGEQIIGDVEIIASGIQTSTLDITANPDTLTGGGDVTFTVTLCDDAMDDAIADNILLNPAPTVLVVTCGDPSVTVTPTLRRGNTVRYKATLPNTTKTYTFTATLKEGQTYAGETATCTVTVTKTETPVTPSKPSTNTTRPSTPTTEVKEDGTKVTTETKPDGTKVETVETPDGTTAVTETKKDGTVTEKVETPDGTKSVTETKPDGTVTEKVEEPDGTKAVTETKPDGSKTATVEQADGTKSETVVTPEGDATITVTDPEGEELVKTEIPATIPEPETKFEDISATPWAEEAINKVAGLELVKGVGGNKYDPVTPMTRGALATVLHRLSNGKTDYAVAFKDVQSNKYYTEGVAWAAKANVVKGISEDIFAPDQIITREQLAVMLARYAKLIGMSTKADAKSLDQFTDGDATGAWAVDGMAWCVEKGILKGKGLNNLDPTADVSRAEVAVMLDRFIALIQK